MLADLKFQTRKAERDRKPSIIRPQSMPANPVSPASSLKQERKREEIIDLAIPLFARVGPDGVSLRQVAAEVGIQVGTLYYYFPEKTLLYRAAVDRAVTHAARLFTDVEQYGDAPIDQLRGMVGGFLNEFSPGNYYGAMTTRELLRLSAGEEDLRALSPETVKRLQQTQRTLKAVIARIANVPETDPELDWLQQFVTGSIFGVALTLPWFDQTRKKSSSIRGEAVREHLLNSLLAALHDFSESRHAKAKAKTIKKR